LTRYPEVKRLSSRFNDGDVASPTPERTESFEEDRTESRGQGRPAFIAFSENSFPATEPPPVIVPITPRQRTSPPSSPRPAAAVKNNHQGKGAGKKPSKKHPPTQHKQTVSTPDVVEEDDYPEYVFDYDYYYDQLVPEHERFFQLPKISTETPELTTKKPESFQIFTHFAVDNSGPQHPVQKPPPSAPQRKPVKSKPPPPRKEPPKPPKPQKRPSVGSSKNSIAPAVPKITGEMAGPFGFPQKGSFFSDDQFEGFPERIEVIYQGFIWAFEVSYPDKEKVLHGGVHRILEDKVKRETLNLKDDHIVRVTGRASPYNLNRITIYTAKGKVYGPWGDRHSDESVDFDVSAPPGHGLAYFSGTIDFGVPLRSIGFHWKKI